MSQTFFFQSAFRLVLLADLTVSAFSLFFMNSVPSSFEDLREALMDGFSVIVRIDICKNHRCIFLGSQWDKLVCDRSTSPCCSCHSFTSHPSIIQTDHEQVCECGHRRFDSNTGKPINYILYSPVFLNVFARILTDASFLDQLNYRMDKVPSHEGKPTGKLPKEATVSDTALCDADSDV